MKPTGPAVTLAVFACLAGLAGCGTSATGQPPAAAGGSTAAPASPSAGSPFAAASSADDAPGPTPSSPPPISPSPAAGPTSGSANGSATGSASGSARGTAPADPVAASNCRNVQEAYEPVVIALAGPADALRDAAAQAAAPPVDTNTRTPAGGTATAAILDLQQAELELAAQGAPAAAAFGRQVAAVRSACRALGTTVFAG